MRETRRVAVALQNAPCWSFCQPLLIDSEKCTRSVEGLGVSHHAPAEIEANQVEEKEGGAIAHFKGCTLAWSQVLWDVFFLSFSLSFSLSLSPSLLLPSFKKRIDEIWHILYTWFDSYVYSQNIYVLILQDFFFCDLCRLRIIRPDTRWEHRVLHMQALALVQQHYLHFTSWEAIPIYPHPADHYRSPAA